MTDFTAITTARARAMLRRPDLSPGVVLALYGMEHIDVRRSALAHPNFPGGELLRLARDARLWVRRAVVRNPASSAGVLLTVLVKSREVASGVVERMVAGTVDRAAVVKVCRDEAALRVEVSKHPRANAQILASLARDRVVEVRATAAVSVMTPTSDLRALVERPDAYDDVYGVQGRMQDVVQFQEQVVGLAMLNLEARGER